MTNQDDITQKRAALLGHQASISAATSNLQALQNTLSQQENALAAILTGNLAEIPDLERLDREYEDALANVAAGNLDEAALDKINAEKTQRLNLEPEIERYRKTITGLQRKITSQEKALGQLRAELRDHLRDFLLAESNAVGVRYLEMVDALLQEHHRLEGLSILLTGLGHVPSISRAGNVLEIPAYELPAFDGRGFFHDRRYIFKGTVEWSPRRAVAYAVSEAEQIRSMGIDFDGYQEQVK